MIVKKCKLYFRSIQYYFRQILICRKYRKLIRNDGFTIISNDCIAGCIYKDLGMQMNSPTINFFFPAADYIKFLKNIEAYTCEDITFEAIKNSEYEYPLVKMTAPDCDDITLHLVHYHSVQEFVDKYRERSKRINFDKLYIIFNDRNGCTNQELMEFNRLPYKNKVCLVHRDIPWLENYCVIEKDVDGDYVCPLTSYIHTFGVKRYIDNFDFVSFLNREG